MPDHAEAVRQCLAQLTDPETGCLRERGRGVGDRLQGGARRQVQRGAAGVDRGAGRDGEDEPPGPGPQSAVHRGDAATEPSSCPTSRWWRRSRPAFTRRFPTAAATTRFRGSGSTDGAGAALGLPRREPPLHRRRGRPSCSDAATCGSSRATWAGRVRSAAIRDGKSVANSFGMSPQSGLPHNNRVGDFDPFALPGIMEQTGKSLDRGARRAGQAERPAGPQRRQRRRARHRARRPRRATPRAQLALDVFATEVRHYLGRVPGRAGRRRRDRVHRRHRREPAPSFAPRSAAISEASASCSTRRPTATPAARPESAREASRTRDLGRADQRGVDRRATGQGIPGGLSHVCRQSNRLAGLDAEGRRDGRPQDAAGRAVLPRRREPRLRSRRPAARSSPSTRSAPARASTSSWSRAPAPG